jgi:hypothetical protein
MWLINRMRKSDLFLSCFFVCLFLFTATIVDSWHRQDSAKVALGGRGNVVREYGLTDLALFTEARYTRHISQSDLHSAFQDSPMSLEHFPSGSLYLPPQVSDR